MQRKINGLRVREKERGLDGKREKERKARGGKNGESWKEEINDTEEWIGRLEEDRNKR